MWRYLQSDGTLTNTNGDVIGHGYSGSPQGRNNPEMEAIRNVGPIPRGRWRVTAPEQTETHGPYVLGLAPEAETETFGRTGFLVHGERLHHLPGEASLGCIILRRDVREAIWQSNDHVLEVI